MEDLAFRLSRRRGTCTLCTARAAATVRGSVDHTCVELAELQATLTDLSGLEAVQLLLRSLSMNRSAAGSVG